MGRILKTFIGNSRIVIFWPQYSKSNHFPEDITFNNRLWVLSFRTFQECCRLQECDKDSQIQSSIQYTCTTTKCIDNVLRVEVFVLNNFGMVINTIEARLFRVGFGKVNVCKSCGELSLFCTICMVCKFWPMAKYCNFKKKSKFMRQNYIFKLSILPLLLLDPN